MNAYRERQATGLRRSNRRGAAVLGLSLALLGIIAAAMSAFLLVTATRAKQSKYERDAIQALYAADAGVEAALAEVHDGGEIPQPLEGQCGDGSYQVELEPGEDEVRVESTGTVEGKIGRVVQRRVVLEALVSEQGTEVVDWQRTPVPQADPAAARPVRPTESGKD